MKYMSYVIRCRLNYAEAVLTELFRVCSIAPVAPPHRVTKDTTLNGYFIPKVCIYGTVARRRAVHGFTVVRLQYHFSAFVFP